MIKEINNASDASVFSHFKYEKHEGKIIHQGNTYYALTGRIRITVLEHLMFTIQALALTILSCGIGLLFSQVRELWKCVFLGTKQIKLHGKAEYLPDPIKLAIYNNWNTNEPKPVALNIRLTTEEALEMITDESIALGELPTHLKQDPVFLIDLIETLGSFQSMKRIKYYDQLSSMLESNPILNQEDFLLSSIGVSPLWIRKCPTHLINQEAFLLKAFDGNPFIVKEIPLPTSCANNKDFILKWMKGRLDTFHLMSEDLKKDTDFVHQLKIINPRLHLFLECERVGFTDEQEILSLIEQDATVFNLLLEPKKSDPYFIFKALNHNVELFKYLPISFRQNIDFVLKFIVQDTFLKTDLEQLLILLLLENNPLYQDPLFHEALIKKISTIAILPVHLLNNRDFLLKILNPAYLTKDHQHILPKKFAHDEEVILKWISIKISAKDMDRISSSLKQNPAFVKKAKQCNPQFKSYLDKDKNRHLDENRALELIEKDPLILHELHPKLRYNKDFLIKCLKRNWSVHAQITHHLYIQKEINKKFVVSIMKQTRRLPPFLLSSLFHHPKLILKC